MDEAARLLGVPRLFQAVTSSASWRVRIALALKRVEYEPVWIDLDKHEQLRDDYAHVAPTRQVPCLDIDGHRMVQSVAIIEYLDETRPDPPLLPRDPAVRAGVRGLVEIVNSVIQPMHNLAVRERLQAQFGASGEAANDWCRYWIERRFDALEGVLTSTHGQYALGGSVTIADVFMYPQVYTSARFGVTLAAYPAIASIVKNLGLLREFAESHAPA